MKEIIVLHKDKAQIIDRKYLDDRFDYYKKLSDEDKRRIPYWVLGFKTMTIDDETNIRNYNPDLSEELLPGNEMYVLNPKDDVKILDITSKESLDKFKSEYFNDAGYYINMDIDKIKEKYHGVRIYRKYLDYYDNITITPIFQNKSDIITIWVKWAFKEESLKECKKIKIN